MKEDLEQYVKKVKSLYELCVGNEAMTKASLIAPLFSILGYDMTDPRECQPEYRADFGKGKKAQHPVDWAFHLNDGFVFIVEAKAAGKKLQTYAEQLGMYFAQASVNLGIYTNGVQWHFYSDLEKLHIMDKLPFLTWDILKDEPIPFAFFAILQKSQFQSQLIRTFAEKGQKQNLLVDELSRLLEPSPDFIKLAVKDYETRALFPNVVEEWRPILVNAINEWAKRKSLLIAMAPPQTKSEVKATQEGELLTDRAYWESKATKETLQATDDLLKLVNSIEPKAALNYNKYYIGIEVDGSSRNFVAFRPQKQLVNMSIKVSQDKEIDAKLVDAGFETLPYDTTAKEYRVKIVSAVNEKQRDGYNGV